MQIENEYKMVEAAFHEKGPPYVRWAAKMAVDLQTGVPWVMCKQDDAPDPIVSPFFLIYISWPWFKMHIHFFQNISTIWMFFSKVNPTMYRLMLAMAWNAEKHLLDQTNQTSQRYGQRTGHLCMCLSNALSKT